MSSNLNPALWVFLHAPRQEQIICYISLDLDTSKEFVDSSLRAF